MKRKRDLAVSVVVPVYNEAEGIEKFHKTLKTQLTYIEDIRWRILYVIDRCTDNTQEILRGLIQKTKNCRGLVLSSRFGHQMSLMAGIENSLNADAIIMMDGDLQHPPNLIPELIKAFKLGNDVVYTVRLETHRLNPLRKLVGDIFYWLLNFISDIPINSNASDFRLISKRVGQIISQEFRERNLFLRGIFNWIGFNQARIEYRADARFAGNSKYSLAKLFKLALVAVTSFSTKPLRIGIFIGLAFSLLASVLIFWIFGVYFFGNKLPSGWATTIVFLLMFSGLQLLTTGLLSIYIASMYDEIKFRPRYVIEKRIGKT